MWVDLWSDCQTTLHTMTTELEKSMRGLIYKSLLLIIQQNVCTKRLKIYSNNILITLSWTRNQVTFLLLIINRLYLYLENIGERSRRDTEKKGDPSMYIAVHRDDMVILADDQHEIGICFMRGI